MTQIRQAIDAYNQHLRQLTHGTEQRFAPRAVMFDMDGVLYNSMPHHAVAWQESMKRFGMTMTAEDAYATEGARGIDTIRRFARQQLGKELTQEEAQRIYDVKTEIFHSMGDAPVFEGVIPLMQQIKASGLTVCIVTGSGQRPLIARLLRDFGEFIDKEHIVTAYDVKRGKPYPDPYLMGLEKSGKLQPWQGIVVENAPFGVQAGVAAHVFTVAVNSGPLPDQVLLDHHPDLLYQQISEFCDDWQQLMQLV